MALPPTIPTSFVPHAASASVARPRSSFVSVFGFFSYAMLGIAFVLALGVFLYGRILAASMSSKDAALAAAQANIDPATIENFVRLRDRLASSRSLLENHTSFSRFFSTLEKLLPASVRFTSLHLSTSDVGAPKIEGAGIAGSFNALAATSNAFATDGHIKDAIFSNISVNRDGSVSFTLSATLDPKLAVFTPSALQPIAPPPPAASVPAPPQANPLP
ncbi:MAG: hypothetical protein PHV99_01995 [Candidatus Pacebacteria bacterium]|nr:hypothetical protein [Candidatus Paceibacterota bacterium]